MMGHHKSRETIRNYNNDSIFMSNKTIEKQESALLLPQSKPKTKAQQKTTYSQVKWRMTGNQSSYFGDTQSNIKSQGKLTTRKQGGKHTQRGESTKPSDFEKHEYQPIVNLKLMPDIPSLASKKKKINRNQAYAEENMRPSTEMALNNRSRSLMDSVNNYAAADSDDSYERVKQVFSVKKSSRQPKMKSLESMESLK